jgi:sulfite dehydrogenase (quinone) subunit SoeB
MPELGYAPVNRYLPPRPRRAGTVQAPAGGTEATAPTAVAETLDASQLNPLLRWLDRALSR